MVKIGFRPLAAVGALAVAASLALPGSALGAPKKMPMPDFTKGDAIPAGAVHDWNLGATGARGWMYSYNMETTEARQVYVTSVAAKSPAAGGLRVGDVILGVAGKPFSHDPRTEFGKALTEAEKAENRGALSLIRWRGGQTETVVVKLPVLGTYSATAPFGCLKSERILQRGCEALARRIADPEYRLNAIPRSLNALALLASGKAKYLPLVKKEAEWAAGFSSEGFKTWYYGYVTMFLAEYVIATGDASVMPGLRRLALAAANGQSRVGSWGHNFALPSGILGGYGMMNSPGLPLTISLILAREAGMKDARVDRAIERSVRLLQFYIGKGAVPYGDHRPWIQTHEDNGKCGMAAVMFHLLGNARGATYFSRMSVASYGPERDTGHTGNFFNMVWAMPGVALSGRNAAGAWMRQFGAWYFDLARPWDGTFIHQGPPAMGKDSYGGWDCTGVYLLAYAMPLKKLYLTGGRKPAFAQQVSASAAEALIDDGRGWSNNDRTSFYDKLSTEDLIGRLASWSPVVRERAAMALGRRKDDVVARLIRMLDDPKLTTRYGACRALRMQGDRGAPAVGALLKTFRCDDLWLRILAAEALAGIGKPARAAVPELLTRLASSDPENDPRNMEQRYLCFALFGRRDGLIGKSLEGVDRELLLKAVRAGLLNEDGRARGDIASVYRNLPFDEIKPLLPEVLKAIAEPAPSGIMFNAVIRMAGLELLAKHHVSEAIELLADYSYKQKKHGSERRIVTIMEMLKSYGTHAKRAIPRLEAAVRYFENEETNYPRRLSRQKAKLVRETIEAIRAATETPKLMYLTPPRK